MNGWKKRKWVQVLLQQSQVECGPACLAMILTYHGQPTTVGLCREQCGVGRDGVSALTLARVARAQGLEVHAFRVEPQNLPQLPLPAIAYWNRNHYVVLEAIDASTITVVDPAIGRTLLSQADFRAVYSGVVLTFAPTALFQSRPLHKPSYHQIRQLFQQIPDVRRFIILLLILSLGLQAFGVMLPYFTEVLVDQIVPRQAMDLLTLVGSGFVILTGIQVVLSFARMTILIALRTRLDTHLTHTFLQHMVRLPFGFFQQRTTGDLLVALESNTQLREIVSNQMLTLCLDALMVIGYLVVLWLRAPIFSLLVVGIGLLQVVLIVFPAPYLYRMAQRTLNAQVALQSYLIEVLKGIDTIKVAGAEAMVLDVWLQHFKTHLHLAVASQKLQSYFSSLVFLLRGLSGVGMIWVGALLVLQETVSLGTMLGLSSLASLFLAPLTGLAGTIQQLRMAEVHLERVRDILDSTPEPMEPPVATPIRCTGAIQVVALAFQYAPESPWVLRDLSFEIRPGEKVALVGRSGSGKSTLLKLLLGLYTPTEGKIYYHPYNLTTHTHTIRRQSGAVLQDTFLFNGTIRANLALGHATLTDIEMEDATRKAAFHHDILAMPMGYTTQVGEMGTALSGGQRQRLALARAFAGNPTFLLLDEATSHLDATTEAYITQTLRALPCTILMIAHRLSTVQQADRLLVLEEGRLVEQGTHHDLLQRNGVYAELMRHQALQAFTSPGLPDVSAARR